MQGVVGFALVGDGDIWEKKMGSGAGVNDGFFAAEENVDAFVANVQTIVSR